MVFEKAKMSYIHACNTMIQSKTQIERIKKKTGKGMQAVGVQTFFMCFRFKKDDYF